MASQQKALRQTCWQRNELEQLIKDFNTPVERKELSDDSISLEMLESAIVQGQAPTQEESDNYIVRKSWPPIVNKKREAAIRRLIDNPEHLRQFISEGAFRNPNTSIVEGCISQMRKFFKNYRSHIRLDRFLVLLRKPYSTTRSLQHSESSKGRNAQRHQRSGYQLFRRCALRTCTLIDAFWILGTE